MDSILKIALTPAKWVSKKILNATLLQFPGGEQTPDIACVYCPEMCRFSCPTAVASGNDVVTPSSKMSLLYKEKKWPEAQAPGQTLWPIYDCTGCGRCTEYCVYGMPVAERLFEERASHPWSHAQKYWSRLTPESDPAGDLAYELGDVESGLSRKRTWLASGEKFVREPKALYFLFEIFKNSREESATASDLKLSWEDQMDEAGWARLARKLSDLRANHRWLLAESVWLSRRLERSEQVQYWSFGMQRAGIKIVRPFAQGRDCMDTGGEGAYPLLFPEQAAEMAGDFWERDRHRADGILCMSQRMAQHLRSVLGESIVINSICELL